MISTREIVYGIYGAYRLCRFDPQGLAYLNATREGFWNSFFAAVIIAPAHAVLTLLSLRSMPVEASFVRATLIEGLAYVILVFAFPLVAFHLTELIGRKGRYFTYMVAYNWSGVIQIMLLLPASALSASELLPVTIANLVELAVTILILAMLWYIARTTLQISGLMAAAFVIADLVIGIIVRSIADGRLGVG